MSIKGYKVFNEDWTCKGFQYEVGKTYRHEGEIEVCKGGFHFCNKLINCFKYYEFNPKNKVAEVEALGFVETKDNKSVTNEIKIVKELNWHEVLDMINLGNENTGLGNTGNNNAGYRNIGNDNTGDFNSGDYNTGNCNTGNFNRGNCNTGNNNTGYKNSGDFNSRDYNTGYYNSGYRNSGDCNTGYRNTGNFNSGDYNTGKNNTGLGNIGKNNAGNGNSGNYNFGDNNTGDWNSGNYNIGAFNTIASKIYLFNKPTEWTINDWIYSEARKILEQKSALTKWIDKEDMTEEEKRNHLDYNIVGGYLKSLPYEEMCINMWNSLTDEEKEVIKKLPNFDKDVFKEITGIKL